MEKLKNLLKSDTPAGDQPTSTTTSGKLTGQGTHFPSKDDGSTTGTTVTGTEPQTRGPSDVSAVPASSTAAATTTGPEQGGSSHIGTTASVPSGHASTGTGIAAVGQTSTYSSQPVTQGNPTSSVVDPSSSDPMTYKKPEAGVSGTEAGVGSGAAATAAGLAFTHGEERKRTELAGSENPYRTTHLDPRVDGLPKDAPTTSSSSAPATSTDHATGLGASAAAGDLAAAGAATAYNSSRAHETSAPSSQLTAPVDPAERSAEYQSSTADKGLGSPTATTTTTTQSEPDGSSHGIVEKVLGAVGLSGVVGALGASQSSSRDTSAVAETPEQPTTTTGLDTYTAPTQQGAPTSHHRKESIPTTAYPTGTFDSPRAINQPIGGAGSPVVHGDQHSYTGRDVAAGVAVGGATAGAAALGAHEIGKYQTSTEQPSGGFSTFHDAATVGSRTAAGTTGTATTGSAPTPSTAREFAGTTAATIGTTTTGSVVPSSITGGVTATPVGHDTTGITDKSVTGASAPSAGTGDLAYGSEKATEQPIGGTKHETDHKARDAAVGAGVGAAAAGAGAYGAHEYSKREAEKAETDAAKEQAAREKELAHQRAQQEKELEKQHKADEKAAAKEEKHHQKELEKQHKAEEKAAAKEEKHHQKELEKQHKAEEKAAAKEEKHHQKELEKEEKKHAKEVEKAEHEEEKRRREERERLAGGALAGQELSKEDEKEREKEKKPNIFKRIFKRRKNDKGEEEEYESEEEHDAHHTTGKEHYGAAVIGTESTYERASGGAQKPSYNPFNKDEPYAAASTTTEPAATKAATTTGTTATHDTSKEAITGLPYDASKDPEAARRLSEHTHGEGIGAFDKKDAAVVAAGTTAVAGAGTAAYSSHEHSSTAPGTVDSTGTHSAQPSEAVTGLPEPKTSLHDKPIAPSTFESTGTPSAQPVSAITGTAATGSAAAGTHDSSTGTGTTGTTDATGTKGFQVPTDFTLGEIVDDKHKTDVHDGAGGSGSLGQKLKDGLHMGGL